MRAETMWRLVSADETLSRPPLLGSSGNVPAGDDLRLDIGWERFERLLVAVAGGVLGLGQLRFRRYGTAGQAQHGIDVAGRNADGEYTVVQCKEYEKFSPTDLRKAVEVYAAGKRPFSARHLIIAVSTPTRATQVEDELAILQDENTDLRIELWGAEQINDALRDRADIVARFWTRETAETFCTGAPLPGVTAPPPDWLRVADQVLLSPLGAEGQEQLARADALRSTAPAAAADAYETLSDALAATGFAGFANVLRHKQLDALAEAGQVDAVAALTARLAATALHEGDRDEARRLSHRLDGLTGRGIPEAAGSTPAAVVRHAELIRAAVAVATHPLGETSELLAALRSAPVGQDTPPYQPLLVLLLAEFTAAQAVIAPSERRLAATDDRTAEPVAAGLAELDDLLRSAVNRPAGAVSVVADPDVVVLRLRLMRAFYDVGERRMLLAQARQLRLARAHAALVLAAQARRDALDGSVDEAIEHWRLAVEHAIHDGRAEDAKGWLYAIRTVNVRYGPWTDRLDDEHRLAQGLPVSSSGRLVRRVRDPENEARRAALEERPIEATLAARRWLADSIVVGDWVNEHTAAELLGDLYADNAEPERAAACYEWAGETKKLTELAAAAGDRPLPTTPVGSGPWWQQATSLAAVGAQHDLLDDDTAAGLLVALTELVARGRAGELADSPNRALTVQATKTACALAGRGTGEAAQALLDLLAVDVARESNQFRYHDREHVRACESIALHHPELAKAALERIFDLADYGTDNALRAIHGRVVIGLLEEPAVAGETAPAATLTYSQRRQFRDRLAVMAAAGRYPAGLSMATLGGSDRAVTERALEARDRLLSRPEPDGHTTDFGTQMVSDSYLVTFLDQADRQACLEKMLAVAADRREAASNRQDALTAAGNLIIDMGDDVKARVHLRSRSYVQGEQDGSFLDATTTNPHPLSSFKVDFGSASLQAKGLRLCQLSTVTVEDQLWVRDRAAAQLGSDDRQAVPEAALVLSRLNAEVTGELDAGLLAGHPLPVVRQLATVLVAAAPSRHDVALKALAADADGSVRVELARQLHASDTVDHVGGEVLRQLRQDVRHSVRRAAEGLRS